MSHVHQGRNQDAGSPGTPAPRTRRRALAFSAGCLLAALVLGFVYPLIVPPILAGDGGEYLMMLQAWLNHCSPDLRPADIEAMDQITPLERPFSSQVDARSGFLEARNGHWYSMHFWLYSLLGVPAALILRLAGASELSALQMLNAACFVMAACFAVCYGHPKRSNRILFLALSATGPVLWFLRWPHPEVFTWCCALVSLALLGRKRYALSAAAAAVGSLQNPPLILLALVPLAIPLVRRQWHQCLTASPGLLPAFLAPLFYGLLYGTPNLIASSGGADWSLISIGRSWSFFADLNQGMLPYVPTLLFCGLAGAVTAICRRQPAGCGVASALGGMILLIQVSPNWNHGTAGMLRYAVWMMPLFAWLAAEYLPVHRRFLRVILVAGLLLQAGLVCARSGKPDYLGQQLSGRLVLDCCPRWYNPEPEIFVERQRGDEASMLDHLPVGFVAPDGSITKILAEERAIDGLAHRFGLEGRLRTGMVRLRHPAGLVYLHPPRGSIKVVEPVDWGRKALESGIRWEPVDVPGAILDNELRFRLELTNTARFRFWGVSSGACHPLTFLCRLFENNKQIDIRPVQVPFSLSPAETVLLPVRVRLPRRPGTFHVELQAALKRLVWDERTARFEITVLGADQGSYLARVESE